MLTSVKFFDKEINFFIRFKKERKYLKVNQHNSTPLPPSLCCFSSCTFVGYFVLAAFW
jgi:hypothetical protein